MLDRFPCQRVSNLLLISILVEGAFQKVIWRLEVSSVTLASGSGDREPRELNSADPVPSAAAAASGGFDIRLGIPASPSVLTNESVSRD